jgi:hypothetical protein
VTLGQRGDALFSSLAVAGDVRPGAEVDVAAVQPGQLGDSQPGLGGEGEHGVVPAACPGALVRGGDQCAGFRLGEPGDECPVELLRRDGEHAGDGLGVLGVAQGRVAEHGADGGEAGVAGAGGVAAFAFEVVEEVADQRGIQVGDVELSGLLACARGGEGQEQPPGVAVGGDGLAAGVPLPREPVGEEGLQRRRDQGHDRAADHTVSWRAAASASNSGAADKYQ